MVNAAFNVLGRPIYSTALNWTRDGALTWVWLLVLVGPFGAVGAVWAQAAAMVTAGVAGVRLGWIYVRDMAPPRPGRH